MSVLMTEYDEEIAKKVWREEALEEGIEKGIEKGKIELYYTELAYSTEQISKKMDIPEEQVRRTLKELSLVQ